MKLWKSPQTLSSSQFAPFPPVENLLKIGGLPVENFSASFQHPVEKRLLCLWKTFFRAVRYFRKSSKMFATRADVFEVIMLFKNNTSPI